MPCNPAMECSLSSAQSRTCTTEVSYLCPNTQMRMLTTRGLRPQATSKGRRRCHVMRIRKPQPLTCSIRSPEAFL